MGGIEKSMRRIIFLQAEGEYGTSCVFGGKLFFFRKRWVVEFESFGGGFGVDVDFIGFEVTREEQVLSGQGVGWFLRLVEEWLEEFFVSTTFTNVLKGLV